MKILVICQYYYPEPFRISNICEDLVRRGHEVMVVTGEPNYPEGKIYEGYDNRQHADETINGVTVHRCPIVPRKASSFYRVLNYYSYVFSAKRFVVSSKCTAKDGSKFDVIFVNQLSPVMMAIPAIAYKEKYNVPLVLYCLDLWPESLIAGGVRRNSLIYKYYRKVSKNIYSKADSILVTSRMFTDYLNSEFAIDESIISYFPQYAEELFEEISVHNEDIVSNFVFAGNIGSVQSVDTILCAAAELTELPVNFHIVGGGTDLEKLKRMAKDKNLHNVIFYGRKPVSEMPEFYQRADAMLVTLKKDTMLSYTLPGKVQSYMASGKPIIGAIDGEAMDIIKRARCGFVDCAEDSNKLAKNIMKFINLTTQEKRLMGKNARSFYDRYFNKEVFMDKLENVFNQFYSK